MSNIMVVGASGFIGKHLIKQLLTEGHNVTAVVRNKSSLNPEDHAKYGNIKIVECEMSQYENMAGNTNCQIDAVVYLAWDGNSGAGRADYNLQINNLHGILDTVEFATKVNCKKFIATGTISEKLLDLGSSQITSQNMMYAAAKISACKMASVLCKKYDINFTWLRLGNVYGEGNTTGNLMSYTIGALLKGERPTYSSATVLQDFVYVEDCVSAISIACSGVLKKSIYYIGTGQPMMLKEYLGIVRDAIDCNLEIGIGERPDDGTFYKKEWFSIDDFTSETGFEIKHSFEEGIKKTIGQ